MESKSHFRRCHLCGAVNVAEGELVEDCESCGKHLAPFYFFDESRAMGLHNSNLSSSEEKAFYSSLPRNEYPPIWGLTVYWEP